MDDDRIELVTHLFALASELAEAALDAAVSGQAATASPSALAASARSLCRRADDLNKIGQAILVAIGDEESAA